MKNFKHIVSKALYSLLTVGSFILTGCYDDVTYKTDSSENFGEGLTICIPNVRAAAEYGASRTDGEVTVSPSDHEGDISDLWLVACDASETDTKAPIVINLKDAKSSQPSSSTYEQYNVKPTDLPSGTYHFYVLANILPYLPEGTTAPTFTSEYYVKNLNLDFGKLNGSNPLMPDNKGKMCLPMACLPAEIKLSSGNDAVGVSGSAIKYDTREGQAIYADLTFLCAKIRYTVLFDGTKTQFDGALFDFAIENETGAPTASKVRQHTSVKYNETEDKQYIQYIGSWNIPFKRVNFPTGYYNSYPKDKVVDGNYIGNLVVHPDAWKSSENQRAWQGIVYLPENRLGITSDAPDPEYELLETSPTYFTYTATIAIDGETEPYKTYKQSILPLQKNGNLYSSEGFQRGYFYDITSRIETYEKPVLDVTVDVSQWTTQSLAYDLHGPYELILETTQISLDSDETKTFWYISDVAPGDIDFYSPKLDDIDVYSVEVVSDDDGNFILDEGKYQIMVSVNPKLPFSKYGKLKEGGNVKNEFKYFEVIAGNIHKAVNVELENLDAFLRLTPKEIMIDVREYIASGLNSDQINIEYSTNVTGSKLKIDDTTAKLFYGKSGDGSTEDGAKVLQILPTVAGQFTSSDNKYTANTDENNIGDLTLNINGIMTGNSYWQNEHTYTLTVSITYEDGGTSKTLSQPLTIRVKPYTTDYTIYFRCKEEDWNQAHIYVYQCLELPTGLPDNTDYETKIKKNLSGRTVGYVKDKTNLAALEYSFTGNVAFRGWKGYGGPDANDPNYNGWWESQGFIIFRDDSKGSDQTFNPLETNINGERYNTSIDLNKSHENKIAASSYGWRCENCSKGEYNRIWPGIAMEKVKFKNNAGEEMFWYRYTLSGLATPGKAMVMFTQTHNHDGANFDRFPKGDYVGVPLFDFPDHEGWLDFNGTVTDYTGNYFVDNNPYEGYYEVEEESPTPSGNVTIYWDNSSSNWNEVKAHCYNKSNDQINNGGWPGSPMTRIGQSSIWEITIPSTLNAVVFNNGNGSQAPGSGGFTVIDQHVYNSYGDTDITYDNYPVNSGYYIKFYEEKGAFSRENYDPQVIMWKGNGTKTTYTMQWESGSGDKNKWWKYPVPTTMLGGKCIIKDPDGKFESREYTINSDKDTVIKFWRDDDSNWDYFQ